MKVLVEALERIRDLVEEYRFGCPHCGEEPPPGAPIDHHEDCAAVIAREALAAHRASSLVDDAELRAKVMGSLAGEPVEDVADLGLIASATDEVLRIVSEHLGRGQR